MQPRFLGILTISFTMCLVMANWFDARIIDIFGIVTDAGTLVFPLTFVLGDVITEVYGFKNTRRAIWIAFVFNFLFMLYGQIVIHFPSPAYALHRNQVFDHLLQAESRIVIASFVAYFIAEPLDAYLVAKAKILSNGKLMAVRFFLSTFLASALGSTVFGVIAFMGVMSTVNLISLILTMWLIKVAVELIVLPASVFCAKRLKRIENIDIYDINTKFSLFNFNNRYDNTDNHFQTN